ncbi:DUF6530 family protein [Enterococcus pallens]|uniref:Uncharacterized protein n=1 Tax=Enterococcus pallens ATCC BAA-351 TaxID=1158607 RepID=R2Q4J0_9ENTE|nr:DUF6530 family protein [Enterococcus pallens]EOH90243.1 hypothetical protein UAU_04072 [Enterococcus pallens ATCC BAA-351]EOU15151.1 hypothetical protein I588_04083 [Enterococcus pallens ATCC BAA-351]OJG79119.1 hypothetical protein RV10_GL000952 [Enterococcus pallens]
MKIPTNLKHKPVFLVEDYDKIDGYNAWESDAKGLTLGLAQWNDRGKVDISGKVWRHTGEKWSRQSEELPITRILDMAILVAQSSLYLQDAYRYEKFYNPEDPTVDIIGLQGGRMTVKVDTENPKIDEDIILFNDTMNKNGDLMAERYRTLKRLLTELGY